MSSVTAIFSITGIEKSNKKPMLFRILLFEENQRLRFVEKLRNYDFLFDLSIFSFPYPVPIEVLVHLANFLRKRSFEIIRFDVDKETVKVEQFGSSGQSG